MSSTATFGIVGGYGATGSVVASELWKSSAGDILIGGRDLAKGNALAARFDARVSAARVDVLDPALLDDFCRRCAILVNCASPVMVLEDRVAQAALRARCHYVDAAGLLTVRERMLPRSREIEDAGLSFVISAGWLPGMSELLPLYAAAQARARMDSLESVSVYFGDTGEWSEHAFEEAAWTIRRLGTRGRGYSRRGQWVGGGLFSSSRRADVGGAGRRRYFLFATPELKDVGARLQDCDFFSYACMPGLRTLLASSLVALLPLSPSCGARLLRNAFRKNRLPVGGFIVTQAIGQAQGRKTSFTAQAAYQEGREYWANGLVPATVARMMAEGKGVRAGVHFLADAVEPLAFMAELKKSGLGPTENFGFQP